MKIDGAQGDSTLAGYPGSQGWFEVKSFELSIDRDLESGRGAQALPSGLANWGRLESPRVLTRLRPD